MLGVLVNGVEFVPVGKVAKLIGGVEDLIRNGTRVIDANDADVIADTIRTATNRTVGLCSFHGDTLVATDEGLLPIRDVTTEMSVASRDPMTGAMSMKPVQAQYSNPYDETVSVSTRDVESGAAQTIVSNRRGSMS